MLVVVIIVLLQLDKFVCIFLENAFLETKFPD